MNVRVFERAESLLRASLDILDRIAATTLVPAIGFAGRSAVDVAAAWVSAFGVEHQSRIVRLIVFGDDAPLRDDGEAGWEIDRLALPAAGSQAPPERLPSIQAPLDALFLDAALGAPTLDVILDPQFLQARSTFLIATGDGARPVLEHYRTREIPAAVGDEIWWLVDSEAWLGEN